jgi:2-iminobutanoate/2-iminopropanoate deaminase
LRKILAPSDIAPPAAGYHHGLVISSPAQMVRLSGQLGMAPDGSTPEGFEAQADLAWRNVTALLRDAGMTVADITKVTSYLVGAEHVPTYVEVHRLWTGGHLPPWTLLLVAGLGSPRFLVEIDVEAMR